MNSQSYDDVFVILSWIVVPIFKFHTRNNKKNTPFMLFVSDETNLQGPHPPLDIVKQSK